MTEPTYVSPFEMRVVQGTKPGAFTESWRKKKNDREVLESVGLEVRRCKFADFAIAYPRPAMAVMQNISILESGRIFESRVKTLVDKLSGMSISRALATLDAMPRDTQLRGARNAEDPEVAIIEGALLGYEPCCVEYYVGTRYLDLPENDVALRLEDNPLLDEWDNRHVLCGACAVGFTLGK